MLIRSKRVWVANKFLACIIRVSGDKIKEILPYDKDALVDYDFGNDRVVPGFIDVHTHGAVKYDTLDANVDGLKRWAKYLPSEGVVAFLPTTVTQTEDVLINASKTVSEVVLENNYEGARILGINFEGPYLDVAYKGAQPEQCIVEPNLEQFDRFQEAANGLIKIMTVSLNKDKNYEMTRELSSRGIIVSIGHGGTTYDEAVLGFANGARLMTHTFNGMTGLHQRMPGQVGASMRTRDEFAEIICDGIHIRPEVMNVYFMTKGPDYAVMVSDSISAKAVDPNDEFYLGGERVYIHPDGSARRANGGLSGSTSKIIEGLKTCVVDAQIPFSYAINACTLNPARLLRIDDRKGRIKANYDADLVVIDENYDIVKTMVLGKFQYSRD